MGLIAEITSDFDFRQPRVIVTDRTASIENVKKIITLTETSVTVFTGKKYVTVSGGDFEIKQIFEGRLLIEGTIQGVEFFGAPDKGEDRRVQTGTASGAGRRKRT